jgi:photosystem II stability/assembly factor-like uncharacterized protein
MKKITLLCAYLLATASFAQLKSEQFKQLRYRFIGPDGNRAIAAIGEPSNPAVMYIGAASGGIFKTDDGGVSWKPIFDNQEVSSIGSLAMSPSDNKQIWAGTGETFVIRPAHSVGTGIFKSKDGGKNWQNMGLEKTGRIGRVIVHPTNPEIVYACAAGHLYGPQQERGLYRTKDGGKSWQKVLFVNESTSAIDLTMDTADPNILYAAMWQININTWGLKSGGTSGGVYRSKDGGDTWEPLNEKIFGKKDRPVGKVAVAVAPSNPKIVYALFELESPALYRSDDGGESWKLQSNDHSMAERASYYTRLSVSSSNADEVHTICVKHGISKDGGKNWKFGYEGGGDNHELWIDPKDAKRQIMAHDGCASYTLNGGLSWQNVVLPIAQMYHVAVDNQIPYNVYGNRQDGYSYKGPSNSRARGIPIGSWVSVGGCESGFAKPDPFDNNIVWSGCYDGGLDIFDARTNQSRDVRVWPEAGYGERPADIKYRWHWNFPLSYSPHTPHRVYVGSQFIHKSDDFGQSWQIISPDLTTNDKSHQQSSGGIAIDNLMTFDGCVLFAIEESPIQKDLIWAGTNDGQVQLTKDGGKTWQNLTANLNVPQWGTVANIEPSKFDAATAYISIDLHQMGDFDPYILKTTDFGKTWTKISDGIPKSMLSFVHVIKEDHKKPGLLFAGTDNNLYTSTDDGKTWMSLRLNMPPAPVYWLEIQKQFDDLVVATYGRGFYILDDISILRNTLNTKTEALVAIKPRDAYRYQDIESGHHARSLSDGQNPTYGAAITYFLPDTLAEKPNIEIVKEGKVVRTLKGTNKAGVNRIYWDLRHESPIKPVIRTVPADKPWVKLNKDSTRILVTWDIDLFPGMEGPLAEPGSYAYNIRYEVAKTKQTQSGEMKVLKDPYSAGNENDVKEQVAFCLALRDAQNQAVELINALEVLRKNTQELQTKIKDPTIKAEVNILEKSATNISGQLYDINLTGAREDAFRNPMQVYEKLCALATDIGSNSADFRPTNQQKEVFVVLKERLQKAQNEYDVVKKAALPKMNILLSKKKLPTL